MKSKYHLTSTAWSMPLPRGVKKASSWFQLIPFGIYCHAKGLQQFTRPEANEVVNHFYSLRAKICRLFKGLPISMHDTKPCGHIVKLEVRDTGLWALVKWNELGEDIIKRKSTGFLTPTWVLRAEHPDVFTPFKLLEVKFVRDKLAPPITKPTPTPPIPTPKPSEPLKIKSITENLAGQNNPIKNSRERFLTLVHAHMKKTGQHYLQSWNTIKQKNPNLFHTFTPQ